MTFHLMPEHENKISCQMSDHFLKVCCNCAVCRKKTTNRIFYIANNFKRSDFKFQVKYTTHALKYSKRSRKYFSAFEYFIYLIVQYNCLWKRDIANFLCHERFLFYYFYNILYFFNIYSVVRPV